MRNSIFLPLILLAAVTLIFLSCGGGSSVSGGIGGTGITSVGRVASTTASITVNGVTYETSGAQVFLDSDVAALDDSGLSVGMFVEVDGSVNTDGITGTADVVRSRDIVEGPITTIDTTASSLTVLGQTVLVDELTVFENITPANLTGLIGTDFVEVSGNLDAGGNIRATRIELKPDSDEVEVTGFVAGIGGNTFFINNLIVDFSNATLDGFPTSALSNGDFVEVKGTANPAGDTLSAATIENRRRNFADDDEVEFEGFVMSLVSPEEFTLDTPVGPITVQTDATTEFDGGVLADIQLSTQLEVEGAFSGGTLIADKVSFRDAIKIEAVAATADGTALTVSLLNLSAITIRVDNLTELRDSRDGAPENPPPLADFVNSIAANDALKIRGRLREGDVMATELEVENRPGNLTLVELQGPVESTPAGTVFLSILGVDVDSTNTVRFEGLNGVTITRDTFFGNVQAGTLVKATGNLSGDNAIAARELELED